MGSAPQGSGGSSGSNPGDDSLAKTGPTAAESLERRFVSQVWPFLERYCLSCHGGKKPKGALDLSQYTNPKRQRGPNTNPKRQRGRSVLLADTWYAFPDRWEQVLERLQAREMPPAKASRQPKPGQRAAVIAWIRDLRDHEAQRNEGDPGTVLARRLSNAEFDYTIRDLTGVDIRPTREFPVDPANEAGFDNTGVSLVMSPALLKKYLAAVRLVADHVVLKPDGLVFAPHPVVTDTDRDKYCVHRIIDFYNRHQVDYADYFLAAWKYRHRRMLGRSEAELSTLATEAGLSPKYLALIWSALHDTKEEVGPLAAVRKMWRELPASAAAVRPGCERMRDLVVRLRRQLEPRVSRLSVKGISPGSQPFVLWSNQQRASQHRRYSGEVFADLRKLAGQLEGTDPALAKQWMTRPTDADSEKQLRRALERFCHVFPRAFVVTDRGPYYNPKEAGKGRLLTAGFHLMVGYFRDDEPLYEWILDERQRRELDALWQELHFVTRVPLRQYKDFIFFERAEPPRFMIDAEFDFARSEDKDVTSEAKRNRLAKAYLGKAQARGASPEVLKAIESYFTRIGADIRWVERTRLSAEPSHLRALVQLTERAYRRPLSAGEQDGALAFYHARRKDGLWHEDALRDTLVSVLLSPHFCYRIDRAPPGTATQRLTGYGLASRLSYFLWSSMPDTELLAHAGKGDLHEPAVLRAQVRRMLRDPRVRGLATEFGGNWLDFRRFEEHNSVDRQRFPSFTPQLRQAMFEEPIRYFMDAARRNRSVLDLLHGNDTFVNRPLARHYGMPEPSGGADEWFAVADAHRYARGGLLPMAVFLTRNAPGLRTSPVKRGYWVVRRVLGETIPPPPPEVPELPKDEAKLGELTLPQLLARHRDNPSCATCHRRFDSIGVVFEGFGPIGERRTKDLGGHPVQTSATFPDGRDRDGLAGLREYLREKRQDDYVDNLCRKLLAYALGRNLVLSDRKTLEGMRARLVADKYALGSLVEAIVTSPQFLNRRGRDDPRGR
jgi:hypothetical protein